MKFTYSSGDNIASISGSIKRAIYSNSKHNKPDEEDEIGINAAIEALSEPIGTNRIVKEWGHIQAVSHSKREGREIDRKGVFMMDFRVSKCQRISIFIYVFLTTL